jgi:hypothetical protein
MEYEEMRYFPPEWLFGASHAPAVVVTIFPASSVHRAYSMSSPSNCSSYFCMMASQAGSDFAETLHDSFENRRHQPWTVNFNATTPSVSLILQKRRPADYMLAGAAYCQERSNFHLPGLRWYWAVPNGQGPVRRVR